MDVSSSTRSDKPVTRHYEKSDNKALVVMEPLASDTRDRQAHAPSDFKPAATATGQRAGQPTMPRQYSANVATTTDEPSACSDTTIAADNYRDLLEASA